MGPVRNGRASSQSVRHAVTGEGRKTGQCESLRSNPSIPLPTCSRKQCYCLCDTGPNVGVYVSCNKTHVGCRRGRIPLSIPDNDMTYTHAHPKRTDQSPSY